MSAINNALATIDEIGADGEMDADARASGLDELELDCVAEPIVLPDGKRIFPVRLFGEPIHELAARLIDTQDPAASRFLRLTGQPGTGKSQLARLIAYKLWSDRGQEVVERHGNPFYGLVEMQPGPSSDEYFFRHEFVPAAERGGDVRLVDSAFVRGDAQRLAGDDRRGQHRPRRVPAVDQRDARRAPGAVSAGDRRNGDRPARVRGASGVQPRAGRRQRHSGRVALAVSGDAGGDLELAGAGQAGRARAAGGGRLPARSPTDGRR